MEAFGRWMQVNDISREGLAAIRDSIATVADSEGLAAHRRAVDIRFDRPADPRIPEDRP